MDSNETLDLEDQTSTDESQEQNNQTFEINWEIVTLEELQKGYLRQSDYTKKTQELSKKEKELLQKVQPTEVDETDEYLKNKGYIKKEDLQAELDAKLRQERDNYYLDKLIENNPSLKQHEEAIKKIALVDDSALDDIIVKYNFLTSDKLSKAKQRQVIWSNPKEKEEKGIADMTSDEWTAYKAKNGLGGTSSWLNRAKTF